jgi:hypothetical protein
MAWFILAAAVAVSIAISFLLRPRAKKRKPEETQDMDNPTAEAGRPYPVIFGTLMVKGLNVVWFGDKSLRTYQTRA